MRKLNRKTHCRISAEDRKALTTMARMRSGEGLVRLEVNNPIGAPDDNPWDARGAGDADGSVRVTDVYLPTVGEAILDVCVLGRIGGPGWSEWEPWEWLYPLFRDGKLAGWEECPYE